MDKETERMGKSAARWLQSEVDSGELVRVLVNAGDLQALLDYVKALSEPVRKEYDLYLMGEWHNTILKVELTESEAELLLGLEARCGDWDTRLELHEHAPEYPLPHWKGYVRK
jgi:hypothetical protein